MKIISTILLTYIFLAVNPLASMQPHALPLSYNQINNTSRIERFKLAHHQNTEESFEETPQFSHPIHCNVHTFLPSQIPYPKASPALDYLFSTMKIADQSYNQLAKRWSPFTSSEPSLPLLENYFDHIQMFDHNAKDFAISLRNLMQELRISKIDAMNNEQTDDLIIKQLDTWEQILDGYSSILTNYAKLYNICWQLAENSNTPQWVSNDFFKEGRPEDHQNKAPAGN